MAAFCDDTLLAAAALREIEAGQEQAGGPATYELVAWPSDEGPQDEAAHEAEAAATAGEMAARILEANAAVPAGGLLRAAAEASPNGRIWRRVAAGGGRPTARSERLAGMLALALPRPVGRALAFRLWPRRWVPGRLRDRVEPRAVRVADGAAAVAVLAWRLTHGRWARPEDPVAAAWERGLTTAENRERTSTP